MNAQHPVQTIRARRALNEYVTNSRSTHHSAVIHPFPEPIQPEACQMCAEPDSDGTDGPNWFWTLLAVSFLTGYITTMIWRFL